MSHFSQVQHLIIFLLLLNPQTQKPLGELSKNVCFN